MSIITDKFIYIHVPKTGGTSLETLIGGSGHMSIREMMKQEKDDFKNPLDLSEKTPLVTIVRNPWSRLVSAFVFLKNHKNSDKIIVLPDTFEELIKNLELYVDFSTPEKRHRNVHFLPQTYFLEGAMGAVNVSDYYVMRTETLSFDFENFKREFNLNPEWKLPQIHKTNYQKHWKTYFTPKWIRDKVLEVYKEDFEKLGYSTDIDAMPETKANNE